MELGICERENSWKLVLSVCQVVLACKHQIGKGAQQIYIMSPCLFNLCAEYIIRNAGLEEAQAGIKIARRNINNRSDMQMTPHLW